MWPFGKNKKAKEAEDELLIDEFRQKIAIEKGIILAPIAETPLPTSGDGLSPELLAGQLAMLQALCVLKPEIEMRDKYDFSPTIEWLNPQGTSFSLIPIQPSAWNRIEANKIGRAIFENIGLVVEDIQHVAAKNQWIFIVYRGGHLELSKALDLYKEKVGPTGSGFSLLKSFERRNEKIFIELSGQYSWTTSDIEKSFPKILAKYGTEVLRCNRLAENSYEIILHQPVTPSFEGKSIVKDKDLYQKEIEALRSLRTVVGEEFVFLGENIDPRWEGERKKYISLAKAPHFYICGITRSGKTKTCLSILHQLLTAYPETQILAADGKKEETISNDFEELATMFSEYEVAGNVDPARPLTQLAQMIDIVYDEYRKRAKMFASKGGASALPDYNRKLQPGEKPLGRLIVIIDEFATFNAELTADMAMDRVGSPGNKLTQLLRKGGSYGINFIILSQRAQASDAAPALRRMLTTVLAHRLDPSDAEFINCGQAGFLKEKDSGKFVLADADGSGGYIHQSFYVGDKPDFLTAFTKRFETVKPLDPKYPYLKLGIQSLEDMDNPEEAFGFIQGRILSLMDFVPYQDRFGKKGRFLKGFVGDVGIYFLDMEEFSPTVSKATLHAECAMAERALIYAKIKGKKGEKDAVAFQENLPDNAEIRSTEALKHSVDAILEVPALTDDLLEELKGPNYLDLAPREIVRGKINVEENTPLDRDPLDIADMKYSMDKKWKGDGFEIHILKVTKMELEPFGVKVKRVGASSGNTGNKLRGDGGKDLEVLFNNNEAWVISAKCNADNNKGVNDTSRLYAAQGVYKANLAKKGKSDVKVRAMLVHTSDLTKEAKYEAEELGLEVYEFNEYYAMIQAIRVELEKTAVQTNPAKELLEFASAYGMEVDMVAPFIYKLTKESPEGQLDWTISLAPTTVSSAAGLTAVTELLTHKSGKNTLVILNGATKKTWELAAEQNVEVMKFATFQDFIATIRKSLEETAA